MQNLMYTQTVEKINYIGTDLTRKFGLCSEHAKRTLSRAQCSAICCGSLSTNFSVVGFRNLKVCHEDVLTKLLEIPSWTTAPCDVYWSLGTTTVNSQSLIVNAHNRRTISNSLGYTVGGTQ